MSGKSKRDRGSILPKGVTGPNKAGRGLLRINEQTLRSPVPQVSVLHEECDTLASVATQGPFYLPLTSMGIKDIGGFQDALGLHLGLLWTPWFPPGPGSRWEP